MRFGIDVAQQRMEFGEIVQRVRFGEALGFDGAWGFDHFVPMYGEGPGNCFEGMTTLAALASATSTIRLGLLVTGVTYRHPSVLAAQAVTVDHASGGRLELALGAAWYDAEHRQLGIEFPPTGRRFDRLEDALEMLTRLFTGEVVSYRGSQFTLDNAQMRPVPVQQPHPPLWIGGSGRRRTLPLVAKWADMWHTWGSPEHLSVLGAEVDRLAEAAGRDPASIGRASSLSLSASWDEVRSEAAAMRDAGIDYLVCGWPGEGRARVEEFATQVMPEFTGD
ncbi:MAG TPA: LLM class flavin-dependent oxidoreductase [Acidimicrobiales bacterium]|nr:LLM class flavin-dependent oxidoreductase [Acidimicrobiales bacterium]HLN41934.1 LLM class flavin-dependent oxidoreductase [Acidimicrobiales bacterium]